MKNTNIAPVHNRFIAYFRGNHINNGVIALNETLIVIVRGLIGFFCLLIFARALGKQQISQLTFFDYVLGITIGSIAASLTTDLTSRAWLHWVGLVTWSVVVFLLQVITLKFRQLLKAKDSKIIKHNLKQVNLEHLEKELEKQGVSHPSEVFLALLNTQGDL